MLRSPGGLIVDISYVTVTGKSIAIPFVFDGHWTFKLDVKDVPDGLLDSDLNAWMMHDLMICRARRSAPGKALHYAQGIQGECDKSGCAKRAREILGQNVDFRHVKCAEPKVI